MVLEQAEFVEKTLGKEVSLSIEYSEIENFKYYCRKNNINIIKEEYLSDVIFLIELTEENYKKMKNEIDNLKLKIIKINKMEEKYI